MQRTKDSNVLRGLIVSHLYSHGPLVRNTSERDQLGEEQMAMRLVGEDKRYTQTHGRH